MDTSNPRAAGSLDPDFANNGIFTFTTNTYGVLAINRLDLSADGSIAVALARVNQTVNTNSYAIGRLLKSGKPDMDFGKKGVVEGRFMEDALSFGSSAINRGQDRILLSGFYTYSDSAPRKPALVQYLTDGTIDRGFGESGFVYLNFPEPKPGSSEQNVPTIGPPDTPFEYYGFKTTQLPDDKILFSGIIEPTRNDVSKRFSVLGRLNADGSLDESFGDKGWVYPKPPRNIVDQHLVQADGKILLAGQMENAADHLGYVARYLPDGTLDHEYGNAGYSFISGLTGGHVTALAFHGADEKVLVGANKSIGMQWSGVLTSLTSEGMADTDFNGGQPVDVKLGTSGFKLILKDLAIDGDGVVLLGDMGNIALARYLLDGSPDVSYGNRNGWQEHSGLETYALVRQPDGKVLATAMLTSGEKIVARFLSN